MAIDNPLNQDEIRLRELQATLRSQLTGFEKKYGISTETLRERFERGELGDDTVFFDVADAVRIISIEEVKKRDDRTY